MTGSSEGSPQPAGGQDELAERYLRARGTVDVPPSLDASIQGAVRAAQPVRNTPSSRLSWIGTAAVLALVLVVTATVASLPWGPGDRMPEGSPATPASGGPDDPFPSEIQGLRVRSVGEAIAADGRRELDGRVVAIAGYFSWDQKILASCPAPEEQPGALELYCVGHWLLAEKDEPLTEPRSAGTGERRTPDGPALTPYVEASLSPLRSVSQDELYLAGARTVSVIFIGHVRDPRARLCRPVAVDRCAERFVVDKIAWIAGEYVPLVASTEEALESPKRALEEPWQLATAGLREPALILSMTALPAVEIPERNPLLGVEGDESTTVWYVTAVDDVGGEDRYIALVFDDATGRLLARTELPLQAPPPTEDPFPSSVLGLSVHTVGEAIALREQGELDGKVVAIAGYFSIPPIHPCPSTLPQPLLLPTGCNDEGELAELDEPAGRPVPGGWEGQSFAGPHLRPVFPPYVSDSALQPARAPYDGPAQTLRVVIVGHFGDRRADACPAEDRERCANQFVVDRVAWVEGAAPGVSVGTSFRALPRPPALHDQEVLAEVEALFGSDSEPLSIVALSEAEIARIDPLIGVHADGSRTLWYVHAVDAVADEDRLFTLVLDDPSLTVVAAVPLVSAPGWPSPEPAAGPSDAQAIPASVACPGTAGPTSDGSDLDPARSWCDARGLEVSKDYVSFIRSHDHCGWESVLFLTVGWPIGTEIDPYQPHQYVRDPERVLRDWPVAPFDPNAQQPADAVSTGITNGRVTLWTSASEGADAIYVVGDSFVERWPRAEQVVACR